MKFLLDRLTLERSIFLLIGLNLLDAMSTHLALKVGFAQELNPLLSWAYGHSPDTFWAVKFGLLCASLLLLVGLASERNARKVLLAMNGVYLAVLLVHAHGWLSHAFN